MLLHIKVLLLIVLFNYASLYSFGQILKKNKIETIYRLNENSNARVYIGKRWIDSINKGKYDSITPFLNAGDVFFIVYKAKNGEPQLSFKLGLNDFKKKQKKIRLIHQFGKLRKYRLFDDKGNLLEKGKASYADMTNYPKGNYIFVYDYGNIKEGYRKQI